MSEPGPSPNLLLERMSPGVLRVSLSGNWRARSGLPGVDVIKQSLGGNAVESSLEFDATNLTGWDSRFVAFINKCVALCRDRNLNLQSDGLPEGVRRLVRLANTVPEKKDARVSASRPGFLQSFGEHALMVWQDALQMLRFLGENVLAFVNLLRGRAQFRWADAFLVIQQCGPQALGIVAMINCLVGLILAFVGAIELQRFGASIYVSDLVGIATVREMGCIMTGIILCGRTGAAFAAKANHWNPRQILLFSARGLFACISDSRGEPSESNNEFSRSSSIFDAVPIEALLPFAKFQVTAIYCSLIALALKILLKVFLEHKCFDGCEATK